VGICFEKEWLLQGYQMEKEKPKKIITLSFSTLVLLLLGVWFCGCKKWLYTD